MIKITDKSDCCGCKACIQVCPQKCISMFEDEEGFLYPQVNQEKCIDCGLCEKVCPVLNQNLPRKPLKTYAVKNKDEKIRLKSSSGGVFTLLAEYIINRNGVVFGAKFDKKWKVIHDYTETIEGLANFRGSKYVQSDIGNCFNEAREFLKKGRLVLFTGTPCQIAGLKLFLRKEYENLITVDVACHGVPSPKIWKEYLTELKKEFENKTHNSKAEISQVFFRDKSTGWKQYCFNIKGFLMFKRANTEKREKFDFREFSSQNLFMKGFIGDLYLRPSCFSCPSKELKSGSDITIADFWGVNITIPEIDDDKGISLVFCNTKKGEDFFENLPHLFKKETDYLSAVKYNSAIISSVSEPPKRGIFYQNYSKGMSFKRNIISCTRLPLIILIKKEIKQLIKRFI